MPQANPDVPTESAFETPGVIHLDSIRSRGENTNMIISGRVQNGVVVLEGGQTLPEGTQVTVSVPVSPGVDRAQQRQRIDLPLISSDRPGSLPLTAERIAELLHEEDVSACILR